jgi:hypothetical protein
MLLLRRSLPARRLIGLLLATSVVVAACSSYGPGELDVASSSTTSSISTSTPSTSDAGPSTTAVDVTTTSIPVAGTVSVFELSVEDCFDAAAPSTEPSEVVEVELVACEEEHGSEVFAQTAFESAGPAYPGEDKLIDYATRFCVDAFEPYVGLRYADSAFTVSHLWPTASAWESTDDRSILCVLFRKDATSVGPARDSGL